jgi:hypothetical protein
MALVIKGYTFITDAFSAGTPGSLTLQLKVCTDDGVVTEERNDFATPLTLAPIRTWAFNVAKAHNSQIVAVSDILILNSPV